MLIVESSGSKPGRFRDQIRGKMMQRRSISNDDDDDDQGRKTDYLNTDSFRVFLRGIINGISWSLSPGRAIRPREPVLLSCCSIYSD